jgi:pimeloyl-ACP methyl ester carboxylesterase
VASSLLLCTLVPRRPDRGLVSAGVALPLEGDPDAGALTLGEGRGATGCGATEGGATEGGATGCGATVVLVHGGGNDRLHGLWYLAETLLQRGHQVVTAHLPGHGRGGTDRFTLEACRRRLDRLVSAAPERPVVVLGQGLGGALALDQLVRGDAEVDGVITVSAPALSASMALNVGLRVLGELRGLLGGSIHRALAYGNPWEVVPAGVTFKRGAFPVRVERGSCSEAFVRVVQALELVDRLPRRQGDAPVLLIHGMRDRVVPHEQARMLAEALGSGVELWIYPRVTHLDSLLDPQVVAEVVQFIDGVRS